MTSIKRSSTAMTETTSMPTTKYVRHLSNPANLPQGRAIHLLSDNGPLTTALDLHSLTFEEAADQIFVNEEHQLMYMTHPGLTTEDEEDDHRDVILNITTAQHCKVYLEALPQLFLHAAYLSTQSDLFRSTAHLMLNYANLDTESFDIFNEQQTPERIQQCHAAGADLLTPPSQETLERNYDIFTKAVTAFCDKPCAETAEWLFQCGYDMAEIADFECEMRGPYPNLVFFQTQFRAKLLIPQ